MILIPIALTAAAFGQSSPTDGRKLVYSCDFSKGDKLSDKDWIFDDGPVYNNEAEKYSSRSGHNAYIKDGALVIEARKEGDKITSARLETVKAWKYVYVEVDAQVPKGNGTWPAVWMLNDRLRVKGPQNVGWPKCGEIDIMENVGFDPPGFHFSLHSESFNFMKPADHQRTRTVNSSDPNSFHKFGMDWRPDSIVFYLDGKEAYRVVKQDSSVGAWPFVDPFYLILNLAIGGSWGGQKGIDPSIFPSRYLIRDVKIYQ